MGGNLFDTEPIKRSHVMPIAEDFILSTCGHIRSFIIAGSFRRGATYCGDIEIVFVVEDKSDRSILEAQIMKQFGMCENGNPKMQGKWGETQFDLHITELSGLGAMLLHTTGSYTFNIIMRKKAKKFGWKLNQYGLYRVSDNTPVMKAYTEKSIFKKLDMAYVEPRDRSII